MTKSYEKSEQDIEVALRYLKFHGPENATREQAVALLEDLQAGFHGMAHHDPQQLLELQKKIDANKHSEKPKDSL